MQIGDTVDDFQLLSEIGRGGMGIVYKAKQNSLDRIVALKVMKTNQSSSATYLERFKREAANAAKLRHPNIVAVHASGIKDGEYYFAMEFVDGVSLENKLANDPDFGKNKRLEVVKKVAEALDYAHLEGVIHRDIKPDNIMIENSGKPMITDFGISKSLESKVDLTIEKSSMGTPRYMSPEQFKDSSHAGPGSDIWSLGIVLYKLLAGETPFNGDPVSICANVISEKPLPSPSTINPSIDPLLDQICLKAIVKDPAQRYSSMGEFARAIDDYLQDKTPPTHLPGSTTTQPTIVLGQKKQDTTLNDYIPSDVNKHQPMTGGRPYKIINPVISEKGIIDKINGVLARYDNQKRRVPLDIFEPNVSYKEYRVINQLAANQGMHDPENDYSQIATAFGKMIKEKFSGIKMKMVFDQPVLSNTQSQVAKSAILEYSPFVLLNQKELELLREGKFSQMYDFSNYNLNLFNLGAISLSTGHLYLGKRIDTSEREITTYKHPLLTAHPVPACLEFVSRSEKNLSDTIEAEVAMPHNASSPIFKKDELVISLHDGDLMRYSFLLDEKGFEGKKIFFYPRWFCPVSNRREFFNCGYESQKNFWTRKEKIDSCLYKIDFDTIGGLSCSGIWGERLSALTEKSEMYPESFIKTILEKPFSPDAGKIITKNAYDLREEANKLFE